VLSKFKLTVQEYELTKEAKYISINKDIMFMWAKQFHTILQNLPSTSAPRSS